MKPREAHVTLRPSTLWLVNARTVLHVLATAGLIGPPASGALAAGERSNERSTPTPAPAPVVLHASNNFDWADAAIGAAAGVGLAVAAAGGITLARNK